MIRSSLKNNNNNNDDSSSRKLNKEDEVLLSSQKEKKGYLRRGLEDTTNATYNVPEDATDDQVFALEEPSTKQDASNVNIFGHTTNPEVVPNDTQPTETGNNNATESTVVEGSIVPSEGNTNSSESTVSEGEEKNTVDPVDVTDESKIDTSATNSTESTASEGEGSNTVDPVDVSDESKIGEVTSNSTESNISTDDDTISTKTGINTDDVIAKEGVDMIGNNHDATPVTGGHTSTEPSDDTTNKYNSRDDFGMNHANEGTNQNPTSEPYKSNSNEIPNGSATFEPTFENQNELNQAPTSSTNPYAPTNEGSKSQEIEEIPSHVTSLFLVLILIATVLWCFRMKSKNSPSRKGYRPAYSHQNKGTYAFNRRRDFY